MLSEGKVLGLGPQEEPLSINDLIKLMVSIFWGTHMKALMTADQIQVRDKPYKETLLFQRESPLRCYLAPSRGTKTDIRVKNETCLRLSTFGQETPQWLYCIVCLNPLDDRGDTKSCHSQNCLKANHVRVGSSSRRCRCCFALTGAGRLAGTLARRCCCCCGCSL